MHLSSELKESLRRDPRAGERSAKSKTLHGVRVIHFDLILHGPSLNDVRNRLRNDMKLVRRKFSCQHGNIEIDDFHRSSGTV